MCLTSGLQLSQWLAQRDRHLGHPRVAARLRVAAAHLRSADQADLDHPGDLAVLFRALRLSGHLGLSACPEVPASASSSRRKSPKR